MAKKPQKLKAPPNAALTKGAAIHGEKILAQYRKKSKPILIHGSSSHRAERITLQGEVTCIVDRPLRLLKPSSCA